MNGVDRMSDYKALYGRMVFNEMELKGSRCIAIIHVLLFFTYISLIKNTDDQGHYQRSAVLSKYIIGVITITPCHALFMRIFFYYNNTTISSTTSSAIFILWFLILFLILYKQFHSFVKFCNLNIFHRFIICSLLINN